jgi:plastocyanin
MKRAVCLALWGVVMGSACGGDVPEPLQQEAPPVQEGVFGLAPAVSQGLPSVVSLHPSTGESPGAPSEPGVIDQLGLAFTPTQLVVRVGQPLLFTNSESLAHNVHVSFVNNDSTVYLADMDPADRYQIFLNLEGGYDVMCDVHPGMRAFVFVTASPYSAISDPDGVFSITEVPPGSYTASVWSASVNLRHERTVEISGSSTELDLSALQ